MNKRLLHEIHRVSLVATGAIVILLGLCIVAQATLLTYVINGVFLRGQALSQVMPLVLILLGVIVGRALLIWGNTLVAAHIAASVKSSLRMRLIVHIQRLGPIFLKAL
ncbi:MAG: hypothetical protein H0U76_08835 [Ktedonobacteraceae bacterium]|nr:hypothetical protein [Ktedonobacteraceae bacterium]